MAYPISLQPTRVKGSGIVTLAAGATAVFSGSDQNQPRRQFIITNLSTTDCFYLAKYNTEFIAIPAATDAAHPTVITFETSDDITVKIPATAAAPVNLIVGELYPDVRIGGPTLAAPSSAAATNGFSNASTPSSGTSLSTVPGTGHITYQA